METGTPLEDSKLIARMARRETEALSVLYDRHKTLLFTLALRILSDRAEAEEVLAETFIQAWRTASGFDPLDGSASGWLRNLCRGLAVERVRMRGWRDTEAEAMTLQSQPAPAGAKDSPETIAELAEKRARISSLLALLSPEQRRALETAYYGGLTHAEISQALGGSIAAVRTQILQGLAALRANYDAAFVG